MTKRATTAPLMRSTRQRAAILGALAGAGGPLLPTEIHRLARQEVPSLGLATVYRNLGSLVGQGEVDIVALPGEASRYERAGKRHHHFFSCTECTRVFDLSCCLKASLHHLIPDGFELESHEIVLYGRCDTCA
jgi:Fur family transcriptional regulator, ferric uptake regulator